MQYTVKNNTLVCNTTGRVTPASSFEMELAEELAMYELLNRKLSKQFNKDCRAIEDLTGKLKARTTEVDSWIERYDRNIKKQQKMIAALTEERDQLLFDRDCKDF